MTLFLTPVPSEVAYDAQGKTQLVFGLTQWAVRDPDDSVWAVAREAWDPEADMRQWVPAELPGAFDSLEVVDQQLAACKLAFYRFLVTSGKAVGVLNRLPVTDERLQRETQFVRWATRLFEDCVTSRLPTAALHADLLADLVGIARDLRSPDKDTDHA